jgi:DNA-directed RNA polymerase specialized sigma24 family protein
VESPDFAKFLQAVRSGDLSAAAEVLYALEPALTVAIRLRLRHDRLRRVFDTSDICQSVLADFVRQLRNLHSPTRSADHLLAYLVRMAHNKIVTKIRHEDLGPEPLPNSYDHEVPGPTPADRAESRDLLRVIRDRLPAAERHLFEKVAGGQSWPDIAAGSGWTADALRMRLRRAIAKVRADVAAQEVRHER